MKNSMRYLRSITLCACLSIVPGILFAGSPKDISKPKEFVVYTYKGPLSPNTSSRVKIDDDGFGIVNSEGVGYNYSTKQSYKKRVKYPFHLSGTEIAELKSKIIEASFFSQPDKDTESATDCGESMLRITLDRKTRPIDFSFRSKMNPITGFLNRLIHQAEYLDDLENHGQVNGASEALRLNGGEKTVLHPDVFLDPMKRFIHTTDDPSLLCTAADALSPHMTPDEWLHFWAKDVDHSSRIHKIRVLGQLSGHTQYLMGSTNEAQERAIDSLFLKSLKRDYTNWVSMSDEERKMYSAIMDRLSYHQCNAVLPIMVDMIMREYEFRTGELNDASSLFCGLYNNTGSMGNAGIDAVQGLLGHPKARVREYAVRSLGFTLVAYPSRRYGSRDITDAMLKRLRDFLPKLQEMAKSDPDSDVKSAASLSIECITNGWACE